MKYISGFKYYYLDMLFFFARYLCLKLTNKSRNDHGPDMDNDEEKLNKESDNEEIITKAKEMVRKHQSALLTKTNYLCSSPIISGRG